MCCSLMWWYHRLKGEYNVECAYEPVQVHTARWVYCDDERKLEEFKKKASTNLAYDGAGNLTYIAPTRVNLDLTIERWPDIDFPRHPRTPLVILATDKGLGANGLMPLAFVRKTQAEWQ